MSPKKRKSSSLESGRLRPLTQPPGGSPAPPRYPVTSCAGPARFAARGGIRAARAIAGAAAVQSSPRVGGWHHQVGVAPDPAGLSVPCALAGRRGLVQCAAAAPAPAHAAPGACCCTCAGLRCQLGGSASENELTGQTPAKRQLSRHKHHQTWPFAPLTLL